MLDRDHGHDRGGDQDHARLAGTGERDRGRDDTGDRRGDDRDQTEPQEARRLQGGEVRREGLHVERRTAAEGRDASGEHQQDADQQQQRGDIGHDDQQPPDRPVESRHTMTFSSIWTAVYSRTATNNQRRIRRSIRWATRDPMLAPRKTPIAVGPATYGSTCPWIT